MGVNRSIVVSGGKGGMDVCPQQEENSKQRHTHTQTQQIGNLIHYFYNHYNYPQS